MVTRLAMEKECGYLFADVRVGSLTLTVRADESHLAAMTLHRGWPVTLAYRLDSIQWR
jgi:tungstate transport system ATP-binding protein